jgi:cysteinyl-tRNA synthetase
MELRLYNTLTREKRPFHPLDPANVRMYVCGPTVYDFAHIGNARPVIVFDVLFRLLRHLYGAGHVSYVRNITDVDDKINARAAEEYPDRPLNQAIRLVTEKTERQFHEDVAALGCLAPTMEPRATEHIAEMKALIERLVASGHSYVAQDHVLFSVASMPDYGRLSKRPLDEMIAGARVEVAPYKRDPMDFVLWKPSKPGEPAWPSPAGIAAPGRPGWHIECSAMSWKHLGETFDIHGGGIDLVFPHHENEIAQSRCAFHTPIMANTWMHNGFLQVEGEKMSKSLGNFVTITELRRNWHKRAWSGASIRLAMLSTHYRQPINWSHERLVDSEKELFSIADNFSSLLAEQFNNEIMPFSEWLQKSPRGVNEEFLDHLFDDLNTPAALAVLRSSYDAVGRDPKIAESVLGSLELLGVVDRKTLLLHGSPVLRGFFDPEAIQGGFLLGRKLQIGLLNNDPLIINEASSELQQWGVQFQFGPAHLLFLIRDNAKVAAERTRIEQLVQARAAARLAKNFTEADRIRDELAAMGVVLKDSKDGTTWEIAR